MASVHGAFVSVYMFGCLFVGMHACMLLFYFILDRIMLNNGLFINRKELKWGWKTCKHITEMEIIIRSTRAKVNNLISHSSGIASNSSLPLLHNQDTKQALA